MDLASNWFFWSVVSLFSYGIHAFLYKKIAEDGGDLPTLYITNPAMVVVAATIASLLNGTQFAAEDWWALVLVASMQGALFFLSSFARVEALRFGTPAHVVFPILKTSAPIVIFLSAYAFSEWRSLVSLYNITGVSLAIAATFMLVEWKSTDFKMNRGIILLLLAVLTSAGASLATKYVDLAGNVDIFVFVLISNIAGLILATVSSAFHTPPESSKSKRISAIWGAATGLLSFIGFSAFLQAIKFGDLSLVVTVNALYVFVPVLLSAWIYKEVISRRVRIAVAMSVASTVLIR